MKTTIPCCLTILVLAAATVAGAQSCPLNSATVFVHVRVLTMDSAVLSPSRTVLVREGKIAEIDPPRIPAGACRIEGAGRVLMPGLSDMHVHTDEREMPLFLANGVTLAREMNGTPKMVALRERIARGDAIGPRLLVTSPVLAGIPFKNIRYRLITSVEDARAAAHEAKAAGYDYLKIYDGLSRAEYAALVEAGHTLGLRLDGHIPEDVGLAAVLDAGQSIQHMDKIAVALAGHGVDTGKVADVKRIFGGRGAWVTPTIASLRALDIARTTQYAAALARPEMAYVDSASLGWWRSLAGSDARTSPGRYYQFEISLLRALRETNTRFLLGTDAGNPLMVAGFSVHDELAALNRDGGFSAFEALRTATRNVGEFLGDTLMGRVVVGAPADLILAPSNPLANLSVLREPAGVMVRGHWFARAQLDSLLAVARRR
ncbi:MAG TPA: amidohydrolase family protein [Gemmatimonadaceae bacterium]|nr:amidohydrolase family protein [Gemmatimonadaceae bacterium]